MKCGGSMKKYATGGTVKKVKKMAKGGAADYNFGYPLNGLPMRPTNGNTDISKNQMGTNPTMKKGGAMKMKKYAKGGFPDLTGDGKVTRADILKGRGVIKRKGGSVKKK